MVERSQSPPSAPGVSRNERNRRELTSGEDEWTVCLAWLSRSPHGRGDLHGASGAFAVLPVALRDVPVPSGATNPAELLAAAHAAGFAAALALCLERDAAPARELTVTATCVMNGLAPDRRLRRVEIAVQVREASGARMTVERVLANATRHYRSALGLHEDLELVLTGVNVRGDTDDGKTEPDDDD